MSYAEYVQVNAHLPDDVHYKAKKLAEASGMGREQLYSFAIAHAVTCEQFKNSLLTMHLWVQRKDRDNADKS